jgi:hypothetical protein
LDWRDVALSHDGADNPEPADAWLFSTMDEILELLRRVAAQKDQQ